MAMTLQEVSDLLKTIGINHGIKKKGSRDVIVYNFNTDAYVDADNGEKKAGFAIVLEEDGEYIKIFSPKLYSYKDGPNKQAFLQALLMVCWKTKLVEFEYDESDGEVRVIVEFPLEDGKLTAKQLERCIRGMVNIIDDYHPVLALARDEGRIDFSLERNKAKDILGSLAGSDGEMGALLEQFQAFLEAKKAESAAKPAEGAPARPGLEE